MRQLEVVAVSEDGTLVLLAGSEDAARPTHQLRIDERLAAAIRGDLDEGEQRQSELTPKEIQARLRAGDSVEQVARAAKVPVNRVMRYAGPVISERDRVVEQARATKLQRPRGGASLTELGVVVEQRLAATAGLRAESVEWGARRRDDGAWIVSLTYAARGGSRTAQWLWQPASRELTSINALGTRLGADDAAASPRRRAAAPSARRKSAASRTPGRRKPARRAATPKAGRAVASKRATASPRSVTKTAAPARRGVTKRSTPKSTTSKAASSSRSSTTSRRAASPVRRRVAKPARSTAATNQTRRAAPPPVVEPATKRTNGRVPIPSWDDVLLGVQRPAARGRRRS